MLPLTIRALLVEDGPADAQLLRELLEESVTLSVELTQARRLADALAALALGGVDVVLLDLTLPDAQGTETVERVHAAAPGVPIVVLTGLDDDVTALRAMQVGAQDYLVKGRVDEAQLARAIRYAIGRKQAEETALQAALRLAREQSARVEAEAVATRFQLLAAVSRALASSLDYRTTLPAVAEQVEALLGDACAIDVLEEGVLRRLACADTGHRAPLLPPPGGAPGGPVAEALRARGPVVQGGLVAAPLVARGQTLGVLTLRRAAADVRYGAGDVAMVHELAGQVALAVDNARLYRAREDVIGIVSHDLRNPLAVIGFAVEALRRPELPPGMLARQVEKISRASDQMHRLITDLLDLTRLEAGTLSVSPEPVEPEALVREAGEQLRPLAEAKRLQLEVEVRTGLPRTLADRERALQVFSNLVGNAIKFTPAGGRVSLGVERLGGELCFSVADTGPGIRREDLDRIFDRYWQGARAHRQGAGLGLAISRGLVQAHGGRIWVESEVGLGTTFFFTLPGCPAEQAGRTPAAAPPP